MTTTGLRIVKAQELRDKISFEDLIEPVSKAFQDSSARRAENGLVVMFPGESPELGDVYVKTGVLRGHEVYIVKVSPWFAVNVQLQQPQGGFIGVFDGKTGHTLAILEDEHYLSDIRTAAAGALAARVLAPTHVNRAAVLGAGVQAYWQSLALYRERPFGTLLIWARNMERAAQLRARLSQKLPDVEIRLPTDLRDTVSSSDVIITTTISREPLVQGEWLRPGQHITAIGADDATKCELDASVLRRGSVFVDSAETAQAHGDVGRAMRQGRYGLEEISGEIGEVLSGAKPGRRASTDITIAKFVGIGAQDVAAAAVALGQL